MKKNESTRKKRESNVKESFPVSYMKLSWSKVKNWVLLPSPTTNPAQFSRRYKSNPLLVLSFSFRLSIPFRGWHVHITTRETCSYSIPLYSFVSFHFLSFVSVFFFHLFRFFFHLFRCFVFFYLFHFVSHDDRYVSVFFSFLRMLEGS